MRNKLKRIRRVPCTHQCEGIPGDKDCLCGGTGDLRDAYEKLNDMYWEMKYRSTQAERDLHEAKGKHDSRLRELKRAKTKIKQLEISLAELKELPINHEEANLLVTRRMMLGRNLSKEFIKKMDDLRIAGRD